MPFGVSVGAVLIAGMTVSRAAGDPPTPASSAGGVDESLRATLLQMARDDQQVIRETEEELRSGKDSSAVQVHSNEVHRRNGALIHKIVDERGWPGRSLAGEDGASAAWLIVQHMDTEPEFQRRCLTLMEAAFINGEVSARNLAFLTDRVLTHEGKPQKYGTQGIGVHSPEDEARIDRNRAAIGLPPWREFVKQRRREYEEMDARDAAAANPPAGAAPAPAPAPKPPDPAPTPPR